ncbi:MAG: hypothetical protein JJE10_04310 [Thermoleophilia bacterium]|nr:hypothetical protein [Thermoleophilia bacterium]
MEHRNQQNLISRAEDASRSLRVAARMVEVVAVIALVLLVAFQLNGVYGWPLFTGLVLTVLTTVLLVGRVARARSIALEIAAVQLELTLKARAGPQKTDATERASG